MGSPSDRESLPALNEADAQKFMTMNLAKRAAPYLTLFEDNPLADPEYMQKLQARYGGSAEPSGVEAQGAARPAANLTTAQQEVFIKGLVQQGYDVGTAEMQEMLARQMGGKLDEAMQAALAAGPTVSWDEAQNARYQEAQTLTPEVLRKALQSLRAAPRDERAMAAMQMVQSGMVSVEQFRREYGIADEDDDPVWTDV
jgi:hypothetical protein